MKCPLNYHGSEFQDELPDEFSEWNDVCPNCDKFQECFMAYYNELDKEGIGHSNIQGDNYPTYDSIHLRLLLNKERREMIEKLEKEDLGTITKDEILDLKIDLEIYNLQCRKSKIKERAKKKEKKS